MSNPTYFVQECPTCGRRLQIRVEYLGKKVVCRHCQGLLIATDPTTVRSSPLVMNPLLHRADELLQTASGQQDTVIYEPRSARTQHPR